MQQVLAVFNFSPTSSSPENTQHLQNHQKQFENFEDLAETDRSILEIVQTMLGSSLLVLPDRWNERSMTCLLNSI
jgi:hypothetical protein